MSKKDRIIQEWTAGNQNLWAIAEEMATTPSYVASVLQKNGALTHYYDLFTTPKDPPNIYFDLFQDRLGFKDIEVAKQSVAILDGTYNAFGDLRDRAGQHHCMVTGLTMYNRALAAGKYDEANVFREWLLDVLSHNDHDLNRDPRVA